MGIITAPPGTDDYRPFSNVMGSTLSLEFYFPFCSGNAVCLYDIQEGF